MSRGYRENLKMGEKGAPKESNAGSPITPLGPLVWVAVEGKGGVR